MLLLFFFKQKTAYEMRISDWSSDVCSSDLPFGDYILDFACIERKLVVELDGGQHAESTKYDDWRTRQWEQAGFAVLRFWNHEAFENREGALAVILDALRDRAITIPTQPSPRTGGLQSRHTHHGNNPHRQPRHKRSPGDQTRP